ncbi:MAG: hypothetical protein FWF33_02915, partial [Clostridiales bacterium]|nr:hypothetical protein [Clostridiales bacterium]
MKLHSLFFGTKRRAFAAVLVVLAALLVAVAAFPASAFASETAAGSSVTPPAATSTDPSTTAPQTAEATGPDAAAPQAAEATGADATAPQTAEATGSDTVAPQAAATTESGKMTPLATSTADITLSYQKDATGFVLAPQTVTVSAGLANQYFPGSTDGTTVTGLDAAVAAVIAIEGSNSQTAVTGAMGIVTDPTYGLYVSNYMGGYLMNFVNGASPDSIVDSLNNGDEVRLITPQDPMGSDSYSYFKYNGSKISSLSVNTGVSVNLAVMYTSLDWSTYPATATEQGSGGASVVVATSNGTGATFGSPVATADASGVAAVSFNKPGTYILSAVNKTSGAVPLASPWLTVNVGAPVGNPIGHVDDITASTTALGQIAIKGWALDGDAVTQTVRVDVYVGGPAGSAGAQG